MRTASFDWAALWQRVRNFLRLKELSDLVENHRAALEEEVQAVSSELRARTADLEHLWAARDQRPMGALF